jgi:hypothetical protein
VDDNLLSMTEKEQITKKILQAIIEHNCLRFDYSDGENLIPIKEVNAEN